MLNSILYFGNSSLNLTPIARIVIKGYRIVTHFRLFAAIELHPHHYSNFRAGFVSWGILDSGTSDTRYQLRGLTGL